VVDFDVTFALVRVFDKPGNILLVFDDENASTHLLTVISRRF